MRPDVAEAQALKTLVHELGHVLLHAENPSKTAAIAEVEVESVAYIVCDAVGLDSGDYSFAYVAHWSSGDEATMRVTAERSISCASRILQGLHDLP